MPKVIVVGAGAAGLIAAGRAGEAGAEVLLLEKTAKPGNKLLLTGQGRCNLTHTGEIADFVPRYNDGRFLYSAFSRFFRGDLIELLNRYELRTKAEGDGRVFPVSDSAKDVLAVLERYARDRDVALKTSTVVEGIFVEDGRATGVLTDQGPLYADSVILAAGGSSYPGTGSNGDSYRMAETAGHAVVPLRPALVPLRVTETDRAKAMQGVSLSGVRITAFRLPADEVTLAMMPARDSGRGIPGKKAPAAVIESRAGDALFTHFGVSGPAVLLMSLAVADALAEGPVSVAIDLKPGVAAEALRQQLQEAFDSNGRRAFRNILETLVPRKMVDVLIRLSGISAEKEGHEITASERKNLLMLLKCLRFNVPGTLGMAAATVTAGGVALKEIDPRTMASRLVKGLYFAGEVMDIDGESGGYNLQAAFSTGWVAGENAAGQSLPD